MGEVRARLLDGAMRHRDPCVQRIDADRDHVLAEAVAGHDPARLVHVGLGSLAVAPLERRGRELDECQADGRVRGPRHVPARHRFRQGTVSALRIPGDLAGEAQRGQGSHAEGIAVRDAVDGQPGVDEHLVDAATGEQDAVDRHHPEIDIVHRIVGHGRSRVGPAFGAHGVPFEREDEGRVCRQARHPATRLPFIEPAEPATDGLRPARIQRRLAELERELRRPRLVAAGHGVFEGGLRLPVHFMPAAGPAAEVHGEVRVAALDLGAEEVAQQMVEAEPPALAVERDEEQVRPLQPIQGGAGPLAIQERVAQAPAHAVEH